MEIFTEHWGGAVLRQCFPRGYTSKGDGEEDEFRKFRDNLSEVFAENARGDVYLMAKWELEERPQATVDEILNTDKSWTRK